MGIWDTAANILGSVAKSTTTAAKTGKSRKEIEDAARKALLESWMPGATPATGNMWENLNARNNKENAVLNGAQQVNQPNYSAPVVSPSGPVSSSRSESSDNKLIKQEDNQNKTESDSDSGKKKQEPGNNLMMRAALGAVNPMAALFLPEQAHAETPGDTETKGIDDLTHTADTSVGKIKLSTNERYIDETQPVPDYDPLKYQETGTSHKYDLPRDWGGIVPYVGTLISAGAGLGNWLDSDYSPNKMMMDKDGNEVPRYPDIETNTEREFNKFTGNEPKINDEDANKKLDEEIKGIENEYNDRIDAIKKNSSGHEGLVKDTIASLEKQRDEEVERRRALGEGRGISPNATTDPWSLPGEAWQDLTTEFVDPREEEQNRENVGVPTSNAILDALLRGGTGIAQGLAFEALKPVVKKGDEAAEGATRAADEAAEGATRAADEAAEGAAEAVSRQEAEEAVEAVEESAKKGGRFARIANALNPAPKVRKAGSAVKDFVGAEREYPSAAIAREAGKKSDELTETFKNEMNAVNEAASTADSGILPRMSPISPLRLSSNQVDDAGFEAAVRNLERLSSELPPEARKAFVSSNGAKTIPGYEAALKQLVNTSKTENVAKASDEVRDMMLEAAQRSQAEHAVANLIGGTTNEMVPRILRGLMQSTGMPSPLPSPERPTEDVDVQNPPPGKVLAKYGLENVYDPDLSEAQIYDAAMLDPTYRAAFNELNPYGGRFTYNGDFNLLQGSIDGDLDPYGSRSQAIRDLWGLEGGNPELKIDGLMELYERAGIVNKNMTDEEKLAAIIEHKWGADNIVDMDLYYNDPSYQSTKYFNDPYASADIFRAVREAGFYDAPGLNFTNGEAFQSLSEPWRPLDYGDLDAYMVASDQTNRANSGGIFTDNDMRGLNSIFGSGLNGQLGGGDASSFAFLPEGATEHEGYQSREWNDQGGKRLSGWDLAAALQAAASNDPNVVYGGVIPYNDFGLHLADQDMTDRLFSAIQKNDPQHRLIGRKDK